MDVLPEKLRRPRGRTIATPKGLQLPTQESGLLAGPWEQAFWFTIDVPLQTKANYRNGDRTKRGNTWAALTGFDNLVAMKARQHRPSGWDQGDPDKPVAARPKLAVVVFGRSTHDAANLDKSVLDALQGVLMCRDSSVAHATEFSERTRTAPGGLIAVARFAPGTPTGTLARGAIALELACLDLLDPPDAANT